ncbi:hypothetical protein CBL_10743 [Carabus blaptoides fortunei]
MAKDVGVSSGRVNMLTLAFPVFKPVLNIPAKTIENPVDQNATSQEDTTMKTVNHSTVLDSGIITSVRNGSLLMAPVKPTGYISLINKHRRAGSTGTTGDESYTTDEDDIPDEPDCAIRDVKDLKEHVTNGVYGEFTRDGGSSPEVGEERKSSGRIPEIAVHGDADLELRAKPVLQHHQALVLNGTKDDQHDETDSWDRGRGVVEVKEQALARLQSELRDAHQELRLRDEEVVRLSRIRQDVESELEDLTASLFQEAHNMVREANVRQAAAERALKESHMQVEVLTAEVVALKALVLTSTPSRPNPHLHPQIGNKDETGANLFTRKHRRSPSHFNLKYGRENSPPDSPVKDHHGPPMSVGAEVVENKDGLEVDPNVHKEFLTWKLNPRLDKEDPFIARIYEEDIRLTLTFNNVELSERVLVAAESGTIFIEAVSDKTKTMFPKKCALLEVPRQCFYRLKIGDQDTWYSISQICRNRITAVCDFLNYLKYIERGLVKSSVHDIYWEIARLRKEMVLARLGLALAT